MRGNFLLTLLILLVPMVGASWSDGSLEHIGAHDAQVAGPAFALKLSAGEEYNEVPLVIEGERIRVEIVSKHKEFGTTLSSLGAESRAWANDTWSQASVRIEDYRTYPYIFAAGQADTVLGASLLGVAGHAETNLQETRSFDHNRPLEEMPVQGLHLLEVDAPTLQVAGDFIVSVYNWDLRVSNDADEQVYWTGKRPAQGPASPAMDGVEFQRIYLHVYNGTMTFPVGDLDVDGLFVSTTTLTASFAEVRGPATRAPVVLEGPLRLALGPVRDGLFDGELLPLPAAEDEALVVAEPPSPQSVVAEGPFGGEITAAGLLLLLAVLLVSGLVAWRVAVLLRLRRAMRAGDYQEVASGAGLESSRRHGPEVVVARTVSMVKTRDYAGAASLLERRGERLSPAVQAYLWACVHAGRGDAEQARSEVIKSILADPSMADEVSANRSLRRFLADVQEEAYS